MVLLEEFQLALLNSLLSQKEIKLPNLAAYISRGSAAFLLRLNFWWSQLFLYVVTSFLFQTLELNLLKHIVVHYYKDMGSGFIFSVPVNVLSIRTCKYRQSLAHRTLHCQWRRQLNFWKSLGKHLISPSGQPKMGHHVLGKMTWIFPLCALYKQINVANQTLLS